MASVGDECVRFPMKCNFMAGILYLSLTDCRTTQLKKHEDKRRREKGEENKGKEKFLSSWQREVKSLVGFCAIDGRHLKRFAY